MVTTRPPKTIVKPTALGPVANTDTKLLIYGLFQKGRVLAQDAVAEMERLRLLVEGVNNKIRVLQRRAYGYRDEEYLKLKIVAAFLPPLPRNAVFNPHESA